MKAVLDFIWLYLGYNSDHLHSESCFHFVRANVQPYSDYLFFLLQGVNEVIADDSLMYKLRPEQGIKSWFHLPQLQWLGLPYKQRFNMTAIREYIEFIVEK